MTLITETQPQLIKKVSFHGILMVKTIYKLKQVKRLHKIITKEEP